jgi:hypothetical protein
VLISPPTPNKRDQFLKTSSVIDIRTTSPKVDAKQPKEKGKGFGLWNINAKIIQKQYESLVTEQFFSVFEPQIIKI